MSSLHAEVNLSMVELHEFAKIAYSETGIRFTEKKYELLNSRLRRRIRELKLVSFQEYLKYLSTHKQSELSEFINTITTNETFFFRGVQHFYILSKEVFPKLLSDSVVLWSAACSSGEEPYSLAIAALERLPNANQRTIKIFASDIDSSILKKATQGVYHSYAMKDVRKEYLQKYFTSPSQGIWIVRPQLRKMVFFGKHNLQQAFPKERADVIFCRNVMIYFDEESKKIVFDHLKNALKPNGYLFAGESEILPTLDGFRRITASVVQKV